MGHWLENTPGGGEEETGNRRGSGQGGRDRARGALYPRLTECMSTPSPRGVSSCCLVLRCVARSLRSLRPLFASGVDVAFALLAVRFCRSLRYTSTLSTLRLLLPPLLLLPLLLRTPLTLARTYLPLVYPTSVAAYVHVIYAFSIFSPPSPPHCTPGIFSRDAVWRGGCLVGENSTRNPPAL